MSNGVEIGEVKINVRPDTSKFAKETKAGVDAAMKKVQSWLDRHPLKVKVDLDDERVVQQAKALNERVKKETEKVHEIRVDMKDLGSVERGIDAIKARLEELKRGNGISIDLNLNEAALNAELARLEHQRRTITFRAKLKGDSLEALKRLTGFRLGFSFFKEFTDFLSNIDKKVPIIGSLALAIGGLSGSIIAATGDLLSLSRALAQIGPGALALPGILGGIGVGLIATTAVFKDFNKQFSQFAIGAGRKTKAGAAWQQLQNQMSDKFWKRVKKPMGDLIRTVFPQVQKGLLHTSDALATFFSNLSTSFTKELKGGAIMRMFASLNKSIVNFSGHTDAIASLVRIFAELGTRQLPKLANWFGKVLDNFNAFMSAAEKTGRLDDWIATATHQLGALGRVIANTGKIFYGLATAADAADGKTGNALDSLANGLGRIARAINSDSIQKRLTGVFTAAHKMMGNISKGAGPAFSRYMATMSRSLKTLLPEVGKALGDVFGALFDYLGNPRIQSGMHDLVKGVADGVHSLRGVMDTLAAKGGEVLTVLGDLARNFGKLFAAKIEALMPLMTAFLTVLDGLVKLIGLIPTGMLEFIATLVALQKASALANIFMGPGGFGGGLANVRLNAGLTKIALGEAAVAFRTQGFAAAQASIANNLGAASMQKIAGAAKLAAGAAGMMLLTKSFSATSDKAAGMEGAVGGALAGFAIGGPWGALIGGFAGGLHGLSKGFDNAAFEAQKLAYAATMDNWQQRAHDANMAYKDSLDQITGAATAATRASVLQQLQADGSLRDIHKAGISNATMVDALLSQGKAQKLLNKWVERYNYLQTHIKRASDPRAKEMQGLDNAIVTLKRLTGVQERQRAAVQKAAIDQGKLNRVLGITKDQLKAIPKNITHGFEMTGLPQTKKDLEAFVQKYGKKSLGTAALVAKVNNLDVSKKQLQAWIDQAKRVPKTVRIAVGMKNLPKTMDDLKTLMKQAHLTPKQLRIIASAPGSKITQRQIQGILTVMRGLNKAKPDLKPFISSLTKQVQQGNGKAKTSVSQVAKAMGIPLQNMKPDMRKFLTGVVNKINSLKVPAGSSSKQVSNNIAAGLESALNDGHLLDARMSTIIHNAIAAANRAGNIHSPSRETMKTGRYLGEGLDVGLRRMQPRLAKTATQTIDQMLAQMAPAKVDAAIASFFGTGSAGKGKGVKAYLSSLTGMFKHGLSQSEATAFGKRLNGIADILPKVKKGMSRAEVTRIKHLRNEVLHAIAPEKNKLSKLYGQWQGVASQIKSTIQGIYQGATDAATQMRAAFNALSDPTAMDGADKFNSFDLIEQNMQNAIDTATRFATAIKYLRAHGLNGTMLQQLIAAGPEAGLASAEALSHATDQQLKQLNGQQAQLDALGQKAGQIAHDNYVDVGMQMSAGLLKGLKAHKHDLEVQMSNLADTMVDEIRRKLGIHSPSRVFRQIGNYTGAGFVEGVKDSHKAAEKAVGDLVNIRGGRPVSGGLNRQIDAAAAANYAAAKTTTSEPSIHIDNISIPIEDLKQIKTLEEFMNMLRLRARQGVAA